VKFILNPYDEFGIEEGLRLREKNSGEVTALTVGDDSSQEILRTALAMGVDNATIIKLSVAPDSYQVAANIASYAKKYNPDLIIMGRQSIDFDSFQVPSLTAELIGIPSISIVSKLTIDGTHVIAEREIEGGKEVVETTLPCIISAQKGLNEPRYPKLPDIMKAKKKPIEEVTPEIVSARVEVTGMTLPSKQRAGIILGDTDADIAELVRALHEDVKVV
jgi:electron transfer flavoprotein beta subunit